jgi:hypothetical protein
MAATVVTLVLLPCLIAIVADIRRAIRWGWSGGAAKWSDPLTPAGTLD